MGGFYTLSTGNGLHLEYCFWGIDIGIYMYNIYIIYNVLQSFWASASPGPDRPSIGPGADGPAKALNHHVLGHITLLGRNV